MKNRLPQQRAFTLMEIIIAISLIAIFTILPVLAYSNFTKQARDTQRKNDVNEIQAALEQYKTNHGVYPESLEDLVEEGYIAEIPVDPKDGQLLGGDMGQVAYGYSYESSDDGKTYSLFGILEETGGSEGTERKYYVVDPNGGKTALLPPGGSPIPTVAKPPTSTLLPSANYTLTPTRTPTNTPTNTPTPHMGTWVSTLNSTGAPRVVFASQINEVKAAWINGKAYVWNGWYYGINPTAAQQGIWTRTTNTWASMSTTNQPSLRYDHKVYTDGTDFYVMGGGHMFQDTWNGCCHKYTVATNTWTRLADPIFVPDTQVYRTFNYNHLMFWLGATGNATTANSFIYFSENYGTRVVALYKPSTNTWSYASSTGAPSRPVTQAVYTGATGNSATQYRMFAWSGGWENCDAEANCTNYGEVGVYNAATNTWSIVTPPSAMLGVGNPTLLWANDKLLILAGGKYPYNLDVPAGYMYTPATNTWTAVSETSAPPDGQYPYAAWSGSWAVLNSFGQTGGAYIFNPALNQWRRATTTGEPGRIERPFMEGVGSGQIYVLGTSYGTMSTQIGGIYQQPPN